VVPTLGLAAALLSGCGTDWTGKDGGNLDADGDGYSVAEGDCWDSPGPIVIDGQTLELTGEEVNPDAEDVPYDGFDADCQGDEDFDADGDGFVPARFLGSAILNLPDFDMAARPVDPDCADILEDFDDRDLHQTVPGATLPEPATVFPGAETDAFYDGIDGDCAGGADFDADGDGYDSADHEQIDGSIGLDCNDEDIAINPDAEEICDDIDNDCDTSIDGDDSDFDESTLRTFYTDGDGDGFGDPATAVESCSAVDGLIEQGEDCDDTDINVNPDADEVCDPADRDEDCDGAADDDDDSTLDSGKTTLYGDLDSDGFGDPGNALLACDGVVGYVVDNTDCDDGDGAINPSAQEVCDSDDVDEDCDGDADDADGSVDAGSFSTFYADTDTDGYGDSASTNAQCDPGGGFVADNTDCDDTDGGINPAATEVCDAADVDEDCDGLSDDADPSLDASTQLTYYTDADSDDFGDSADSGTGYCEGDQPAGLVTDNTDCDDGASGINPDATEVCDGADVDEDCDGLSDDDDSSVDTTTQVRYYTDGDADGFGDEADSGTLYCDAPSGVVDDNTDCDDSLASINPDADEVCDASDVDENCNGDADDADATVLASSQTRYYTDADADGYGSDADAGTLYCDAPSGVIDNDDDCNDGDVAINPLATEVCDAGDTDEDCDGLVDDADPSVDATTLITYYTDADGDGYGDLSSPVQVCDPGSDEVSDSTDCDDSLDTVFPEAGETCNDGVDSDCDGSGTTETFSGVSTSVCVLTAGVVETEALRTYTGALALGGIGAAFGAGDLDGAAEGADEVVIGAPGTDRTLTAPNTEGGAVYVLPSQLDDGLPGNDSLSLTTTNAQRFRGDDDEQWVGAAVAVGDVDDDGIADLVVGAPGVSRNGSGLNPKGRVYVVAGPITGTGDAALSSAADYSSGGKNGQNSLGAALVIGGDADNDGTSGDMLIAAPSCGAAFYGDEVYEGGGQVMFISAGFGSLPALLSSTTGDDAWVGSGNGSSPSCAGWAVGMGDFDATGIDVLLMSEPLAGGLDHGRVYLDTYDGTSGTIDSADFVWGPGAGSLFGDAIATGDLDGDGYEDAVVSATYDGTGTGAVYILDGDVAWTDGDYIHQITGVPSIEAAAANTRFGASVSVAGDIDGDGNVDLLIGEPDTASGGSVWLMYGPFSGAITASSSTGDEWTSTESSVGEAVLGELNHNGDGYDAFLVGAPEDDSATTDGGQAYLFSALGD
jgi:hypothetical protein